MTCPRTLKPVSGEPVASAWDPGPQKLRLNNTAYGMLSDHYVKNYRHRWASTIHCMQK